MNPIKNKIANEMSDAQSTVNAWVSNNEKIVFTNGCFDLLHIGHIKYLQEARSLGDRLVVAINSDASVKRLKGASRPIKDEENRLYCMAALSMVDLVVLFEDDTPIDVIKSLNPNVLVKGGDWSIDQIVGSEYVLARGGSVQSLKFIDGQSTTSFVQKLDNK